MNLNIIVLEHEILGVLKRNSMKIVSFGSDIQGHVPIDKIELPTAFLHYGTLVALLNNQDFLKDKNTPMAYMYKAKKEEVTTDKFDWPDIADSLQTLAANGHIKDEFEGKWLDLEGRTVKLTEEGLAAYNKKTYLKEAIAEQIQQSTLDTNRTSRMVAWASLFVAIAATSFSALQYFKNDEVHVKGLEQIPKELKQQRIDNQQLQKEHNQYPQSQQVPSNKK